MERDELNLDMLTPSFPTLSRPLGLARLLRSLSSGSALAQRRSAFANASTTQQLTSPLER